MGPSHLMVSRNQTHALYGTVGSIYGGLPEMYAGDLEAGRAFVDEQQPQRAVRCSVASEVVEAGDGTVGVDAERVRQAHVAAA